MPHDGWWNKSKTKRTRNAHLISRYTVTEQMGAQASIRKNVSHVFCRGVFVCFFANARTDLYA